MYTYKLLDSKTYLPVVNRGTAPADYPVQLPAGVVNYFPYVNDDGSWTAANINNDTTRKTGIPVDSTRHPVGNTQIEIHPWLRGPVYPGISITGSVVEISQIKIWTSVEHGGNGMNWDYVNAAGNRDEPIFQTPETIPAYVPANSFTLNFAPNKSVYTTDNEGVRVFTWTGLNFGAQWPALQASGYKIDITTTVDPYYADVNIYYQLFPIGTPHPAFIDNQGKVTIEGDETQKQEVNGEKAYKRWTVKFDKDKMLPEETASARFVLIARNLLLDDDKNAPDYSLLQSLPEYNFRIEVTRPAAGSSWD